jgi:uncharacterized repeat protein (TIGR01451 family)
VRRRLGPIALGIALGAGLLLPVAISTPQAYAAVPPAPNPEIEQSCGLELTLVLDASGSIGSDDKNVRAAGDALLTALKNTNSTARVTQFATLSQQLASRTQIDDTSMADGGALAEALQGYNSPRPPRPADVNIYQYRGGNPQLSSSFTLNNGATQYTNWDQGLRQARGAGAELTVFVTDGDPTAYDLDKPGDPFDPGPPPDVAMNTNTGLANQLTMDRAVEEANSIKALDTRMLAIGVGSALNNNASRDRLIQISGPQVARDADLANVDSLNDIDVALVTNFEDLAQVMRSLVLQLCSPSLTVRKLAQTAGEATYQPEEGRAITVTPSVPGGDGFDWILPPGATGPSQTVDTDANGFSQFQWEPIPPEEDSTATVAEATDPDFTAGRPGADNDFRCQLRDEFGNVRTVEGDFADPANPQFVLDPIGQEIVTCTLYNSFNYAPDIALQKVNSPTEVRGDIVPAAQVTSTYTVTNPGNTPLSDVTVVDDRCGPVEPVLSGGFNVGDSNQDDLLDLDETWTFSCTQPVRVSRTSTAGGQNIVNIADVTGIDPAGTAVTDTATDDVDVFTPHISLTKTANGEDDQTVISAGESVTYSYDVTNDGNTPLGSVSLVDDTPPCEDPTLIDDGDGDAILGLGETWTYECVVDDLTEDVVNTSEVSAVPLNPLDANNPFDSPNPPVTDEDPASVVVVSAELHLAKSVDPDLVLLDPGANPPAEPVTYTFTATNNGSTPLARPDGTSTTAPGWLEDGHCLQPATYVSGDTDGDELLDVGESWTFTCDGEVVATTLNTASLTGQPTQPDGTPLPVPTVTDRAFALVEVAQPDLTVTKTSLVPVVLDPDAPAVDGPDTPTPRPAEYRYEFTNDGDVPLSLTETPPADDKCAPLVFVEGDTNGDDLLDPGEVWFYDCTTSLGREDADTPPGDLPADVVNTVDVVGVPFVDGALAPDKQVTGTDSATVEVIEPSLLLTKTASSTVVRNGAVVTYTVTVENTGTSGLQPTGLADDKCALVYESGDTDADGVLDGADTTPEIWTFSCSRDINVATPSDTDTNVATVTAVDQLGNSYESSDDATVRVIEPAIELTKVVDHDLVPAGTPVTYTFEVRNVGQSDIAAEDALANVDLIDLARPPLAPECRRPELVAKEGGNQDDILERDPPEVWRYQCTSPIDRPTTNVAEVAAIGGTPIGEQFPVADFAAVKVQPFHPGIAITKTADPTRLVGSGDVTYTYRVTNTGDVPLAGVADTITDDTCSPVTYVRGDLDDDGLLDTPNSIFEDEADETWVFTCTTLIDEDTTNVVVVTGSPSTTDGTPLCGVTGPARLAALQVEEPCDVNARDRAVVTVTTSPTGPGTGPGGGNQPGSGPTAGGLGDTGAPAGLRGLLLAGLLLVAAGVTLVGVSRRRPSLVP